MFLLFFFVLDYLTDDPPSTTGSIPVGAVVLALALVGIPNGFPYQGTEGSPDATARRAGGGHGHGHGHEHGAFVGSRSKAASKAATAWARIDVPGTLLILLATLAFTACFQEADSRFPWNSAYVISLLVASGVLWIALIVWERHVTLTSKIREPVLPWTFFTDRTTISLLGYVGPVLERFPPLFLMLIVLAPGVLADLLTSPRKTGAVY